MGKPKDSGNAVGARPPVPFQLLAMRVPNIDGHPNAIVGKFRTLDVLGRVLVDLLHLTRRLGKPNLLPHLCTGGDFLRLGRGRALPISYQDSISIKNLSKKIIKKISKIFPKSLDKFK